MPLVIHPRVRKAIRRGGAAACLTLVLGTGTALADTPAPSTVTPVAQAGDTTGALVVPGAVDGTTGQPGLVLGSDPWSGGQLQGDPWRSG